jgi:hypothetical protein
MQGTLAPDEALHGQDGSGGGYGHPLTQDPVRVLHNRQGDRRCRVSFA